MNTSSDVHASNLNYLINHLFLPPKLPQEDDSSLESLKALLRHFVNSADAFYEVLKGQDVDIDVLNRWRTLIKTLKSMEQLHQVGQIPLDRLCTTVKKMEVNDIVALNISKQNAGVILRKPTLSYLTLEFFQASPTAAAVTSTIGKLIIQFPSHPRLSFPTDPAAIDSLCSLLVGLDCIELPDAAPVSSKAGSNHSEIREVADIRYISEVLGGIARACTEDVSGIAWTTAYVTKRVNDHVLWNDCLIPWRRAPLYLIIRVVLQLSLKEWDIDVKYGYKVFITFALARLLEQAVKAKVPSDFLFVMNAKLAIRVSKFSDTSPSPLLNYISQQNKACGDIVRRRWRAIQEAEASPLRWMAPTIEEIQAAEGFTLTKSRQYLSEVYNRSQTLSQARDGFSSSDFESTLTINPNWSPGVSPPAPIPSGISGVDLWRRILDVEHWILNDMPHWMLHTLPSQRIDTLGNMISQYGGYAISFKNKNPELFSRVFLTLLELWVALDTTVIADIPILADYSPELPLKLCEPLLLPTLNQMKSVQNIEDYLQKRHARARHSNLSLFKYIDNPNSFAARYFQESTSLQSLRSTILDKAKKERASILQKWKTLNEEHNRLIQEASCLQHTYIQKEDRWGDKVSVHASGCRRCYIEQQARGLRIEVHEWPMPEEDILSRLVVFELRVPKSFGVWRDTTYSLATAYTTEERGTRPPQLYQLSKYLALSPYFQGFAPSQQLTIASTVKSFLASHYRTKSIPCEESEVIQNHALRYELFTSSGQRVTQSFFPSMNLRESCTPSLPPGPYTQLAWSVIGTTHTSNMVIARQSECPVSISYHEWDAFGHIRAGSRLQWQNMMLQLAGGTLTLGNPAVFLLFRQAAWQAEKASGNYFRGAHCDLSDPEFGHAMLRVLNERLVDISENWQEGWTTMTLSMLGCRLFSLSVDSEVRKGALRFLSSLRQILSTWIQQVLRLMKSKGVEAVTEANELRDRVIQLALTCRSTYALELDEVQRIFNDSNSDALAFFVDCSLVLQNILPADCSKMSHPLRYLLEKDVVISSDTFGLLLNAINNNNCGLDNAICRNTWQAFRRNGRLQWRLIGDRWMTCETRTVGEDGQVCHVYVNLYDGTFFVNGRTIGSLPKDILKNSLFQTLFPHQYAPDIVPSTMKGMDYQFTANMKDQEVHFALRGSDLLIRTRGSTGRLCEFVPREKLLDEVPTSLLHQTYVVYHHDSQTLGIYSSQSGWDPLLSSSWTMHFSSDPSVLPIQYPRLIDVKSPSNVVLCPDSDVVKEISAVFEPLEMSQTNLLVVSDTTARPGHQLRINLPRYKLSFFVKETGKIECKDFPGFSISAVQSIGTLCGLRSKLVLRTIDDPERIKVIVPDGLIKVFQNKTNKHHPHSQVAISLPSDPGCHVRCFIYDVDALLGRLVGDGTLSSWYTLAYLHILTSYCLGDTLTQRTGVQQATLMLQSANAFSFMKLSDEHEFILKGIAKVTPTRRYYPQHLTSMEVVAWSASLSFFSQISHFAQLVQAILIHADAQKIFYSEDSKQTVESYDGGNESLRKRAYFRNARYASFDLQKMEIIERNADRQYKPKRCLHESESAENERSVFEMAATVRRWPTGGIDIASNIWGQFKSWGSFSIRVEPNACLNDPHAWLLDPCSKVWFALLSFCLKTSRKDDFYGFLFTFGIIASRPGFDPKVFRSLLLVATNNRSMLFKSTAGLSETYDLGPGHILTLGEIQSLAENYAFGFNKNLHQRGLDQQFGETKRAFLNRRQRAHDSACKEQCQSLAIHLFSYWPCATPPMPEQSSYSLIHASSFYENCKSLFSSRFNNHSLFNYAKQFQTQLNHARGAIYLQQVPSNLPSVPSADLATPVSYIPVTLKTLMDSNYRQPAIQMKVSKCKIEEIANPSLKRIRVDTSASRNLISNLKNHSSDGFTTQYTFDLSRCVDALERQPSTIVNQVLIEESLLEDSANSRLLSVLNTIHAALNPKTTLDVFLSEAGLWPSVGPESLLSQLSLQSRGDLSKSWRSALTLLAETMADSQQVLRLNFFKRNGRDAEYRQEIENACGKGWDIPDYPDWLLIQLDADLLIRPVQASIAQEMMYPGSKENTVMQLNMGEGKSSVIVPIISATLANSEQLVRVLVLKPLCNQMFDLLKQRICRLSNRRLFYLPFSRDLALDVHNIQKIVDLFKLCARVGGVLICQPEHILSFKLMGLHSLCRDGDSVESQLLLDAQEWLNQISRDILDESDEILSVRYQLIYSVGTPKAMQGHPDRWQTLQEVLSILRSILEELAELHPEGLEVEKTTPDSFPRTRLLTQECGIKLVQSIARLIINEGRLKSTPFRNYAHDSKRLAFRFLTDIQMTMAERNALRIISEGFFDQLLLIRGLFAHGILVHCLKEKRWRVDYGLDPSRSMLAVPYRAKDCPAPRAEFAHPDIILLLTCLSYYYGGLDNNQLETTFHHLVSTDSPDLRYQDWIKGIAESVPESLHNLRGLNLEDTERKHTHIFPLLRKNKAVIDFYLSECIFPKEAKEFEHKLTTNSWDLAQTRDRLTTGFSGTNDHSYLLPLSIQQLDSEAQRHTSAQVLEYLLRTENRRVVDTGIASAKELIEKVVAEDQHVMVLLDVGAQVLELQNDEVAREWLKQDTRSHVEAAIYCDRKDEFYVLTRDGRNELLATSLYKTQLEKALVYLDEAHTRGTDFKFPRGTRAVVTLGPKTSKDKLVQGCMRMRKLGSDHSILFFASKEIVGRITACVRTGRRALDSSHVLSWTLKETCSQIVEQGPLWADQGDNFDHRQSSWEQYRRGVITRDDLATVLREPESRTLEELYDVHDEDMDVDNSLSQLQEQIRLRCQKFNFPFGHNTLMEEQERELAHEKEEEREVERALQATPLEHSLDPYLVTLIQKGEFPSSLRLISILDSLRHTSQFASFREVSSSFFQSNQLLATVDFSRTVALKSEDRADNYLRAVQWILTLTKSPNLLLILSPFEANELLPHIRRSQYTSLHLYSPRSSRTVRSMENLDFYTVPRRQFFVLPPRRVIHELNLFAGQLFFSDRESFEEVCYMLGLYLGDIPNELRGKVDVSGFVKDEAARRDRRCDFYRNPLATLLELFGWRRKGQGFNLTHVGLMLHGNNLGEDEFVE